MRQINSQWMGNFQLTVLGPNINIIDLAAPEAILEDHEID